MELRPLTARSVVLSTLLGSHPPRLPVRDLVRVGELFGVAEGTVRVALSRMVAAGDLVQVSGEYALTERLLQRLARQDESLSPRTRPWGGAWEIAVVTADRRAAPERAALRQAMAGQRLAELREGTWLRPANLVRIRPAILRDQCAFFTGRPEPEPARFQDTGMSFAPPPPLAEPDPERAGDPGARQVGAGTDPERAGTGAGGGGAVAAWEDVELVGRLWDLAGWAATARELAGMLVARESLAEGFVVSAAVLRHLLADPLLPVELLPPEWPGGELRRLYERFQNEFVSSLVGRTGALS